jgi:hypothetical protein
MAKEIVKKYYKGFGNLLIRYYFYARRGLEFMNEFRYLIMGILAIFAILKLQNFWLIPLMFIISLPVLIFLGWLYVHKVAKPMEYYTVEHSTHWGRYQFELWEDIRNLLKKLLESE